MKQAVALVVLLLGLLPAPARAEDPPVSQQALLLLRILAYDRELKNRSGGKKVVVAVAYRPGDKSSEEARARVVGALQDAADNTTVLGMPVIVVSLAADGGLDDRVASARPAALYLCPGLEDSAAQIVPVTRKRSVLSFSPRPDPVKNGVAVGLSVRGLRTAILVNLAAARAEGVDFESAFLRVAEVQKP